MRRLRFSTLLLLLASCTVTADALTQSMPLPTGWLKGGTPHGNYETGLDGEVRRGDAPSVFVRGVSTLPDSFGTILQVRSAAEFRKKRVRLSGYVKAAAVREWAGLWLRVDPEDPGGRALAFDNMVERPIKGTQEWTRHEIVVDVPEAAARIYYGLLLSGTGTVWGSSVGLEVVGPNVPLTPKPGSCCTPRYMIQP